MQAVRNQDAGRAALEGGRAETSRIDREFKDLFVSLVDPAGLLDTKKCAEIAADMERAASRSGYRAGARMASLLADSLADIDSIASRPVADGALGLTYVAFHYVMKAIYDSAEAYRDGRDAEPLSALEDLKKGAVHLKSMADALGAASPPGPDLSNLSKPYIGEICRDVVRRQQEKLRAELEADGYDPIFPPRPRPLKELSGDYADPNVSSAEMIADYRGRGPPDGYDRAGLKDDGNGDKRI